MTPTASAEDLVAPVLVPQLRGIALARLLQKRRRRRVSLGARKKETREDEGGEKAKREGGGGGGTRPRQGDRPFPC